MGTFYTVKIKTDTKRGRNRDRRKNRKIQC